MGRAQREGMRAISNRLAKLELTIDGDWHRMQFGSKGLVGRVADLESRPPVEVGPTEYKATRVADGYEVIVVPKRYPPLLHGFANTCIKPAVKVRAKTLAGVKKKVVEWRREQAEPQVTVTFCESA